MNGNLSEKYPGGCFVGFNFAIDRPAAEALASSVTNAVNNGFKKITLFIASPGGDTDQARYLYSLLEGLPVELVTHNVSRVASAANLLFLAGDRRYATPRSSFFFHETTSKFSGDVTQKFAKERVHALKVEDERSAEIVALKTGQRLATVEKWMRAETTLEGELAIKHGIINDEAELVIPQDAYVHQVQLPAWAKL